MTSREEITNEKAAYTDSPPSYHGLHITTNDIPRTSISNLPYGLHIRCCRVGGWELWQYRGPDAQPKDVLLAGEYDLSPLRLDVNGVVIVDGFKNKDKP